MKFDITLRLPGGQPVTGKLELPTGLFKGGLTRAQAGPMTVGVNVPPAEYTQWFPKFAAAPSDTRIHFPPGQGLLPPTVTAIATLPAGTLPWISHKDEVPVPQVGAYWTGLLAAVNPPPGRKLRWTFRHEPEDYDHARWVAYWRDLRLMWEDHPLQHRIELVNIHTLYPARWKAHTTAWRRWMLPGVAHLDGWDCFPALDGYEPPPGLFGLPVAAAQEFGMPFCIPEWGTNLRNGDTGDARADWFAEGLHYLDQAGCRFVGLRCDTEVTGGRVVDYRPIDAQTLDVWNQALTMYQPRERTDAAR